MKSVALLTMALVCAGLATAAAQDGRVTIVSQSGLFAPTLPDALTTFSAPVLSGSGTVAFIANSSGAAGTRNQVIFLADGTSLTDIAANQAPAPTIGGSFQIFTAPLLSERGTVAFAGQNWTANEGLYAAAGGSVLSIAGTTGSAINFSDLQEFAIGDNGKVVFRANSGPANATVKGLYFSAGAGLTLIVNSTQAAVGGITGNFSTFSVPVVNNLGVVAFQATTSTGQQGLYATSDTTLVPVATTQKIAPEIDAAFTSFSEKVALNDSGTVAFSGFSGTKKGIFIGSGGALRAVATTAPQAHGLPINFLRFSDPAINNAGTVAFRGTDTAFADGIYTGDGGALRVIADAMKAAPHLTGYFDSFGLPAINSGGTVAFRGAAGAGSGIYLGDGQELITAAYTGQSVGGSTVTGVSFAGGPDRGGASQFNDNGQIAYNATLANGASAILLYTPTLHYRSPVSGAWSASGNWTVSLRPAAVHDVIIDPSSSLTVTGPNLPVTVKSLTINGLGVATAILALQINSALTATDGVTNGAAGVLTGTGKINGDLTNAGLIAPGNSGAGAIGVVGNVNLLATSRLSLEIGGLLRKTGYDFLKVSGAFTLGGALDVSLLNGFTLQFGQSFDLFDAGRTVGAFRAVNLPALTGGLTWDTSLLGSAGQLSVVPEPGTAALLAGWSVILLGCFRRSQRAAPRRRGPVLARLAAR